MKRVTVTDQAGRKVQVLHPSLRIVSLAPSNTEILYAIGAQDLLVGVTEYCDYPASARLKNKVGGYSTVDIDLVRASRPDLVLAGMIHLKGQISELEKLDCPILITESNTLSGMLKVIEIAGTVTGKNAEASNLINTLNSRINQIVACTTIIPTRDRPRVYFLHEMETWKTFGLDTIGDTLTDLAGGYNIGRDYGSYYPYPSISQIAQSNPDIIIAETGYGRDPQAPLKMISSEPGLTNVTAIKNKKVYGIESDIISRAGPRMVDGLERLASIFYPMSFSFQDKQ